MKTIPHFESEKEEALWYQKHKGELDDYFEEIDQTERPEISWELRKKILDKAMTDRIGLRIPPLLKTILKEAALKKGFHSYNEFIRQSLTRAAFDVLDNEDLKRIASL
ncbi:MAG: hypothetical protein QME81_03245 [bacterium]|nr:hypothetical protein [bacterium]